MCYLDFSARKSGSEKSTKKAILFFQISRPSKNNKIYEALNSTVGAYIGNYPQLLFVIVT